MARSFDYSNWIQKNDAEQCEWLTSQLIKYNIPLAQPPISTTTYDAVISALHNLPQSAETRELIRSLKANWAQKKYRKKLQGRKAFSYVMPTNIEAKINFLAKEKGVHKNSIIEGLITNAYNETAADKDILKKAIKEHKDKLKLEYQKKSEKMIPPGKHRIKVKQLNTAQKAINRLKKFIDKRLKEQCKHRVLLEDAQMLDATLTSQQEDKILKEYKEKSEYVNSLLPLFK
ncbi:MAG: hypothetical protein K6L73_07175 [Cellvibrionaceae bacterium]